MWLIYALGGGWGHLTRAVALARVAQRERSVRILTNSPYAGIVASALPEIDLVTLETRAEVVREIVRCRPECLIVDTFPRGIGGELADVDVAQALLPAASRLVSTRLGGAPVKRVETSLDAAGRSACATSVLVHRDLNPRYVGALKLREFVAAHYDLVLVPGPGEGSQLGNPPPSFTTDPWLVRNAHEIPRDVPVEAGCVLVCASGKAEELEWYGAVISQLRRLGCPAPVRCVAAERPEQCPVESWVQYWPAMDLFGAAAVVVGGGGYNTIEECLAWKVPLIARPWPRMYDRQDLRAQRASARGRVIVVNEPEEAARLALEEIGSSTGRLPSFANGAVDAVALIGKLLGC